ncbi:IS110 family transposase [Leptolyngbya sp. 7M]|uniref:IS110 family transposase n=1 Tax=Leptolyngbya sp. 7M TaxID=2812896 RepID=UPI001CED60EA|nr:IS110 family transposase [Leptolyngbya sp. 7M]
MPASSTDTFAACIGLDWASKKHDVALQPSNSDVVELSVLPHTPEAIHAWVAQLRDRFEGQPVALCTEQKQGALIYALCQYDFIVLYPVNPQTVAKYRRAFTPSRAKDDPTDACILLELLLKHRDKLTAWQPGSSQIRELQKLVEWRRKFVDDGVRLTNRITDILKGYYPQALDWFTDKNTLVFCDFLTQYPTLEAAQQEASDQLNQFFLAHHCRYKKTNAKRIEQIKAATPLTNDVGVIEPSKMIVKALAFQLRTLLLSIEQFNERIEQLFAQMPEADLFAALPGAGEHLAPRLLLAFGEERSRFSSAQELLQYAGIAPVTERSGKKDWVHWRWSCPKFLRQSFVEWAEQSRQHSFWAKAFYEAQKRKGKTHQEAIRALAFKWIRIIWRCWQDRKPYDEAKYLLALKKKGSPLVAQLAL